ncbi:S8 family peptidase [Maricaulis sp.]|uniref:S8 family peptidase n=1 Tax=Maricaulis sp. TaxID=1486257 RepID=UPI003A9250A3
MKNSWRTSVAVSVLVMALASGTAHADNEQNERDPAVPAPAESASADSAPAEPRADEDSDTAVTPYRGDIDPFHGDINPFSGDINPFYGDISPFWGDISPFWGDINPFQGDISAFWGDIDPFYGDINSVYGNIGAFWSEAGPLWGDINAFWNQIDPAGNDIETLRTQLNDLFDRAEAVFGDTIETETNQSFRDEFLQDMLARYGIDPADPDALADVTAVQRSAFFLAFYDGLMNFSGTDRVDHWMPAINWSPSLSQAVSSGDDVLVGLLDFSFTDVEGLNVRRARGERDYLNFNHGAAVAGLIGAPHDGGGVMGMAPGVTFNVYNPYDESHSTNWTDVERGLRELARQGSQIVNLSLGLPGWTLPQRWSNILKDWEIAYTTDDILLIIAAGNDGRSQTVDIDWTGVGTLENLLIVGSVDPNGQISRFSNRPGTACLLVRGRCQSGHQLMDRFLVAPGELLLVSDGEGGVTRMSGTSFATPLVTGAAALVMGRWEWLEADDVATVLLSSATDLGAPGVDEVYGAGLLNVDAAMSPLDMTGLVHLQRKRGLFGLLGAYEERPIDVVSLARGQLSFRSASDYSVTVFEPIGDEYRDFEIAVSDLMFNGSNSDANAAANAETYLRERTWWLVNGRQFQDTGTTDRMLSMDGRYMVTSFAAAADPRAQRSSGALPFQAGFSVEDRNTGRELQIGSGEGAMALGSQTGFGLFSDHRPETGGVNPVLGFASGGAYAMTAMPLGDATRLSVGVTTAQDQLLYVNPFTGEERAFIEGSTAYEATAFLTDVSHRVGDDLTLHASYTWLNEATGLLGAQGQGALGLEGGATTDAISIGADADLAWGLSLSSSATLARTRAASFTDSLLSMPDATVSSAFQLTARRDAVFSRVDALRFSLIQPLHVESGALEYTSTKIVDRETGEVGLDSQRWELGGERPIFAELLYATSVLGGRADLSLFSRAQLAGEDSGEDITGMATGARFRLEF